MKAPVLCSKQMITEIEAKTDAQTASKAASKRERTGGRPPKIDFRIITEVVSKLAIGLPLRSALRMTDRRISTAHWNKSLAQGPALMAFFEEREGLAIQTLLEEMRSCPGNSRAWTVRAWLLERRWRDDYGQQKQPITLSVTQNCIALSDEISQRARAFISKPIEKALPEVATPATRLALPSKS